MLRYAACVLPEHVGVYETRAGAFSRYGLLISILAVYLLFPTRNYYWDGIGSAESIERSPMLGPDLVHPNHLIYDIFGFVAYRLFHSIGLADRALYALQLANAVFSTLTLYFFMRVLCHLSQSVYLIALLTSLLAVSATWWKFSTDADSYVPAILLLVVSFYLVLPMRPARPVLLGLIHGTAMLFHQLAVFFYPVALLGILEQSSGLPRRATFRRLLLYGSISAGLVVLSYLSAFYWRFGQIDLPSFAGWTVSHSPEVAFSFDLGKNLATSLKGSVKLFLGGRLAVLREFPAMFTIPALATLAVIIVALGFKLVRYRKELNSVFSASVR